MANFSTGLVTSKFDKAAAQTHARLRQWLAGALEIVIKPRPAGIKAPVSELTWSMMPSAETTRGFITDTLIGSDVQDFAFGVLGGKAVGGLAGIAGIAMTRIGKAPKLVAAFKLKDGRVIKTGQIHVPPEWLQNRPDLIADSGFVDETGRYLTRDQAAALTKTGPASEDVFGRKPTDLIPEEELTSKAAILDDAERKALIDALDAKPKAEDLLKGEARDWQTARPADVLSKADRIRLSVASPDDLPKIADALESETFAKALSQYADELSKKFKKPSKSLSEKAQSDFIQRTIAKFANRGAQEGIPEEEFLWLVSFLKGAEARGLVTKFDNNQTIFRLQKFVSFKQPAPSPRAPSPSITKGPQKGWGTETIYDSSVRGEVMPESKKVPWWEKPPLTRKQRKQIEKQRRKQRKGEEFLRREREASEALELADWTEEERRRFLNLRKHQTELPRTPSDLGPRTYSILEAAGPLAVVAGGAGVLIYKQFGEQIRHFTTQLIYDILSSISVDETTRKLFPPGKFRYQKDIFGGEIRQFVPDQEKEREQPRDESWERLMRRVEIQAARYQPEAPAEDEVDDLEDDDGTVLQLGTAALKGVHRARRVGRQLFYHQLERRSAAGLFVRRQAREEERFWREKQRSGNRLVRAQLMEDQKEETRHRREGEFYGARLGRLAIDLFNEKEDALLTLFKLAGNHFTTKITDKVGEWLIGGAIDFIGKITGISERLEKVGDILMGKFLDFLGLSSSPGGGEWEIGVNMAHRGLAPGVAPPQNRSSAVEAQGGSGLILNVVLDDYSHIDGNSFGKKLSRAVEAYQHRWS